MECRQAGEFSGEWPQFVGSERAKEIQGSSQTTIAIKNPFNHKSKPDYNFPCYLGAYFTTPKSQITQSNKIP